MVTVSSFNSFCREFENEGYKDIGETMFKFAVQQAVKNLCGEVIKVEKNQHHDLKFKIFAY